MHKPSPICLNPHSPFPFHLLPLLSSDRLLQRAEFRHSLFSCIILVFLSAVISPGRLSTPFKQDRGLRAPWSHRTQLSQSSQVTSVHDLQLRQFWLFPLLNTLILLMQSCFNVSIMSLDVTHPLHGYVRDSRVRPTARHCRSSSEVNQPWTHDVSTPEKEADNTLTTSKYLCTVSRGDKQYICHLICVTSEMPSQNT